MSNPVAKLSSQRLNESLYHINDLLDRHRLVLSMVHSKPEPHQELVESLVQRQQLSELQKHLRKLHTADIAYILETLPPEDRLLIWQQLDGRHHGDILLEISDGVRPSLIDSMSEVELDDALKELQTDELNLLADDLPEAVLTRRRAALTHEDRNWLDMVRRYPEHYVGRMMSNEMVVVYDDQTLKDAIKLLRQYDELPTNLDKLFVVDRRRHLRGVLPLKTILTRAPKTLIAEVMATDVVTFIVEDTADHAGMAFDRYDLVSAPVISESGRLLGRLTVDVLMEHLHDEGGDDALNMAGLQDEEDLFSSVFTSARNRWVWLGVNLFTAFIASRVISAFEETISELIALAVLMPIVASIGGNSGNQTTALVIRGLALDQIKPDNRIHLLRKEITIALLNGVVWGSIVGLFAFMIYQNTALSGVISLAMMLNFLIAALAGVSIPLILERMGRDPALGSSILLTATVDSMGFFYLSGAGCGDAGLITRYYIQSNNSM